ncbi:MAG: cyclic nucleotide-binding domain-containing protein [Ilumatobacteraceae bacterium]
MWSKRAYVDHLKGLDLFSGFSRKDLEAVASVGQHLSVKAGTVLAKQDEEGFDAFVVLSGAVAIKRNRRMVCEVGAGSIIGELAIIDHGLRTATATCVTDCEILVLSRGSFRGTVERVPALQHKLLATLAGRVRELDKRIL